jgi:hypothetical protein
MLRKQNCFMLKNEMHHQLVGCLRMSYLLCRILSQLDLHKKQAQKLETQTLPPLEREIDAVKGDMARLEEEIGTELQH